MTGEPDLGIPKQHLDALANFYGRMVGNFLIWDVEIALQLDT